MFKRKNKEEIGNKSKNLFILRENNFQIANFIVLDKKFFLDFIEFNQINLKNIKNIKNKILNSKIPKKLLKEIERKISNLKTDKFAVRSSSNVEDSKKLSWAGQFSSFLNVEKKDLEKTIKKVWGSAFSEKVLNYKKANNLKKDIFVSVIIQEMIDPKYSGIAFSINPLNFNNSEIIINAGEGLGDKIVDGKIKAVEYLIKKDENFLINETKKLLEREQILKLSEKIKKIENIFNYPVDIEWAIDKNNQIYFLQVRPVLIKNELVVYDNSNISESYAGISSPLSYSFAKDAYREVYKAFSLLMGASKKEIEKNKELYDNMLTFIGNHFYYNLTNWYKMISLFPAYKISSNLMEAMMGIPEKYRGKIFIKNKKTFLDWPIFIFKTIRIIYIFSRLKSKMQKFNSFFDKYYEKQKKENLEKLNYQELENRYLKLEKDLIKKWTIPIANDFAVMTAVGLSEKLYKKWTQKDNFFDFIKSSKKNSFISLIPGQKLSEILEEIQKKPEIFNSNLTNQEILKKLKEKPESKISKLIFDYIQKFGNRVPNELKLESEIIENDSEYFIEMLKNYTFTKKKDKKEFQIEELKISFIKKWTLNFLFSWSKNTIAQREESRFRRAQAFDLIRQIFLTFGKKLKKENKIESYRDIFYLKVDEIFNLNKDSFKKIILERKKEEEKFRDIKLKSRYEFYTDAKEVNKIILEKKNIENINNINFLNNKLSGKITSNFKGDFIEGGVVVMKNFDPSINIDDKILVTEHTDPGWTVIFSLLKGIVIEKGGMLSHASIVAREFEIPCLVNTENATTLLKTGNRVRIYKNGNIEILKK